MSCLTAAARFGPYVPEVLYSNPEGPGSSSTDVGANFLFGVGRRGPVVPYVQAKLIAKDDTEFVIGVGLRF